MNLYLRTTKTTYFLKGHDVLLSPGMETHQVFSMLFIVLFELEWNGFERRQYYVGIRPTIIRSTRDSYRYRDCAISGSANGLCISISLSFKNETYSPRHAMTTQPVGTASNF